MQSVFLGLGGMGYGMAANLAQAGSLAAVWNRTPDKARAFAEQFGVAAAPSVVDAAARAHVIVLCVSADADVLEIVDALVPALDASHIVIDCSTTASDTARAAADRLAVAGAAFVDAPVSGGTEGAQQGTLTFMVGARRPVFERIEPLLEAMGSRIAHMGDIGSGQATKAVNQILCAGINQAVCEGLRFAEALDLPLDDVIDVVGSGAAGNWFVNHRGKTMVRDVFDPGFKLKHHHKDLGICLHMAESNGGALPLTAKTREDYDRLLEAGYGDADISALYVARGELFPPDR